MTEHGSIKTASYLINKNIFYGSDVSKIYNKDLNNLIAKQKDEIKTTLETLTSPSSSTEEASNIILSYIS